MQQARESLHKELGGHFGIVADDLPLLSNLSVVQNIALIRQYHDRLSTEDSKNKALTLLDVLGLCAIAGKRNPDLSDRERFIAKLLRASQRHEAVVVIDRPFTQLPGARSIDEVIEVLRRLDNEIAGCIILDYDWHRERYGALGV